MDIAIKYWNPTEDLAAVLDTASPASRLAKLVSAGPTSRLADSVSLVLKVMGASPRLAMELYGDRIMDVSFSTENKVPCIPRSIQHSQAAYDLFCDATEAAIETHRRLLRTGVPRSAADMILPRALGPDLTIRLTYGKLYTLVKRYSCVKEDPDCREFCLLVVKLLAKKYPELSQLYTPLVADCDVYQVCTKVKGCGKHKK